MLSDKANDKTLSPDAIQFDAGSMQNPTITSVLTRVECRTFVGDSGVETLRGLWNDTEQQREKSIIGGTRRNLGKDEYARMVQGQNFQQTYRHGARK